MGDGGTVRHFKYQIYFDSILVKAQEASASSSSIGLRLPGHSLFWLKLTVSYGPCFQYLSGLPLNDFQIAWPQRYITNK